jgi:homocysteine S-methyltransferase
MGTVLHDAGIAIDACFDALNLSNPELISAVHRAYIAAGADIVETNTFGANRFRLEAYGLADKVREINKRAVKLAREEREISGRPVWIAGSVGPIGRALAPIGVVPPEDARAAFREQIEALLEGGVDALFFETMGSLAEIREAVAAAKECSDLPIVAMMTFAQDGRTMTGEAPQTVVDELANLGVDLIGANCSVGPAKILPVMRAMANRLEQTGNENVQLACLPNAGWPTKVGSRVFYPSSPEYFGSFARNAAEAGVRLIGGCCGTTPEHIRVMRAVLDSMAQPSVSEEPASDPHETQAAAPVASPTANGHVATTLLAADGPTDLARKIGKQFVVSVEIDPPKGLNPEKALVGARLLQEAGVDVINVADSPMARVRMSALTLCYLIQHEVGIETIIHFTTRDRSLMGLQSELLGAHAVGVRNILALTGDPPSLGDYPDSTAVYDVDSIGLIRVLRMLNEGKDTSGASIGKPARFTIACAVDPTKPDLDQEVRRLKEKIDAGAQIVMTQPVFDMNVWWHFLDRYEQAHGTRDLGVPVMLGILPLQSSRHAEFLHNEVPGITLTDEVRERMRKAGSNGRTEGIRIAQELLLEARPYVDGTYLMPSFGRYEVAAAVLEVLQPNEKVG